MFADLQFLSISYMFLICLVSFCHQFSDLYCTVSNTVCIPQISDLISVLSLRSFRPAVSPNVGMDFALVDWEDIAAHL